MGWAGRGDAWVIGAEGLMGKEEDSGWVGQLYQLHGAELKRYLTRKLGDSGAADDVAQDAYLKLHRLRQSEVRHPRALLFTTASNLAASHLARARAAGMGGQEDADRVPDEGLLLESVVELDDAMRILERIVEKMPHRLRQVWIMRLIEDLSPDEIANRLGLALNTVNRRLERAMVRCRERLLKLGVDRPGPR
jgi:RNA polymerase sigma-70 factor (ECF subfamily)